MARNRGGYSRLIAGLKILLPLVALALLSTLFLLSDSREPLENVPFAGGDAGAEIMTQGVSAPYYSGTTEAGDLLTMTARRARPLAGGDVEADTVQARMAMKDGGTLDLDSALARLNDGERALHLTGGVTIRSSQGYTLRTKGLATQLDRIEATSDGHVSGDGPLGQLEAGQLDIAPADESGAVQMHFTGGVKLIYQPPGKDPDQ